jgi:hypothetical protein
MRFSLAYLKNDKQILIRRFGEDQPDKGRILDFEDVKEQHIQGLIYNDSDISDENRVLLNHQVKFYPIRSGADLQMNLEQFEDLGSDTAQKVFSKINDSWLLSNNIGLLEELFKVTTHLKELWPNDRITFFEELWFVIRSNIGASSLKIIYNDIQMSKKEHEKNKLVHGVVNGEKSPIPTPATEAESLLMKHYKNNFNSNFEITEYDPHKGEIIIAATINNSPVLVMAKINRLSRLQKALLGTLFDGLQQEH